MEARFLLLSALLPCILAKSKIDLTKLPIEIPVKPYPVASAAHYEARYLSGGNGYGYVTDDQYKIEVRKPDGSVQGVYGYKLPDGKTHITSYVSDDKGYRLVENDVLQKISKEGTQFHQFLLDGEEQQKQGEEVGEYQVETHPLSFRKKDEPVVEEPRSRSGAYRQQFREGSLADAYRSAQSNSYLEWLALQRPSDVKDEERPDIAEDQEQEKKDGPHSFVGPRATAIAGPNGVAKAMGHATAIVGPNGLAVSVPGSRAYSGKNGASVASPTGIAIAGPGGVAISDPFAVAQSDLPDETIHGLNQFVQAVDDLPKRQKPQRTVPIYFRNRNFHQPSF